MAIANPITLAMDISHHQLAGKQKTQLFLSFARHAHRGRLNIRIRKLSLSLLAWDAVFLRICAWAG